MKPIPSDIGEYLSYDPETGKVVWIKQRSVRALVGSEAGSVSKTTGYLEIRFNKQMYQGHRVVWFLHYGEDPGDRYIDHINRDKTDNRISNLRLATKQQNGQNRKDFGVHFHKGNGSWVAKIQLEGKAHHIGSYDCPLLAGVDYLAVKSVLHPKAHV